MVYNGFRHTRRRDLFSLRIGPLPPVPIGEPAKRIDLSPETVYLVFNREGFTPNRFQARAATSAP